MRVRAPARNRSISVHSPTIPPRCSVMTLEAIRYRSGSLQILNQLLLPHQTVYDEIRSVQDAYEAIKSMKVRSSFLFSPPPPLSLSFSFLSHYPADVHARCDVRLSPPCMSFVAGLLCSTAPTRVLPYARRRAPVVGLYFCFGCTCSTRQLPTNPLLSTPPPPPPPKKTLPLCVSFHIIMCRARQTRYVHRATHP